jgi:colanic acid/amylovoran biosynthesis glycosyltransferase
MKIAFVVNEFPSISETYILHQIVGLIDQGHEIVIFAGARGIDEVTHPDVARFKLLSKAVFYNDMPRYYLGRLGKALVLFPMFLFRSPLVAFSSLNVFRYGREALSLRTFFQAYAFLHAVGCRAVLCHFGPNGLVASRMKGMGALKARVYVFFHNYDLTSFVAAKGQSVYKNLFRRCEKAFAVSHYARIKLMSLGCPEEKIEVLRMGIRTEKYPFFERILKPGQAVRLISVGRCVEKKGLQYGIEATEILYRSGFPVQYVIIGDGPLKSEYEALVEKKGMEGRVVFLGWRDEQAVLHELETAAIYLLPSTVSSDGDEEGIPVILMEALAMGLIVVATDAGGVRELIVPGKTGYLVPQKDPQALADTVEAILNDPLKTRELSRKGRELVEKEYHISHLNKRIQEEVIGKDS